VNYPKLRLVTTYREGAAPIAYLDYMRTVGSNMVTVENLADEIPENDPDNYKYEKVVPAWPVRTYTPSLIKIEHYPSGHILVSDKVIPQKNESEETPVFWSHELKYEHYDVGGNPSDGVRVYRDDGILMNRNSYLVEYGSGSLKTQFDDPNHTIQQRYVDSTGTLWSTGVHPTESNLFRMRLLFPDGYRFDDHWYKVSYNKYYDEAVANYDEFINPYRIYEQGKHYTSSANVITWTNPRASGNMFLKKSADTNVKVLGPAEETVNQGWFVRVKAGSIVQYAEGVAHTYTSDWDKKNLEPTWPSGIYARPVLKEKMTRVSDREFQVKQPPIYMNPSGVTKTHENSYYLEYPYYIPNALDDGYNPDGTGVVGLNVYVDDRPVSQNEIEDVQERHGVVRLKQDPGARAVTASYIHENNDVTVRTVDLNPTYSHPGVDTKNEVVDIYLQRATNNPGIDVSGHVFWCYKGSETSGSWATDWVDQNIPTTAQLIGRISLNTIPPDSIETTDIRRRGGGILKRTEARQSESIHYADIAKWDGKFLPAAYGLVIQIPQAILTRLVESYEEEGHTTEQANDQALAYLKSVIERYMPVGANYVLVDENLTMWRQQLK